MYVIQKTCLKTHCVCLSVEINCEGLSWHDTVSWRQPSDFPTGLYNKRWPAFKSLLLLAISCCLLPNLAQRSITCTECLFCTGNIPDVFLNKVELTFLLTMSLRLYHCQNEWNTLLRQNISILGEYCNNNSHWNLWMFVIVFQL